MENGINCLYRLFKNCQDCHLYPCFRTGFCRIPFAYTIQTGKACKCAKSGFCNRRKNCRDGESRNKAGRQKSAPSPKNVGDKACALQAVPSIKTGRPKTEVNEAPKASSAKAPAKSSRK